MNLHLAIGSHPLRRRLWKAAGLLWLLFATVVIANRFLPPDRAVSRQMIGHDFLPFYAAGQLARQGNFSGLYDLSTIKAAESQIARSAGLTESFGPWWNPPFAAWVFAPFSRLPFERALLVWELAGAVMLAAAIGLLVRLLPETAGWRNWLLVPVLLLASNPAIAVAVHGQNTFFTLLLITLSVTLWRGGNDFSAGLVAGLLLYKPQHAVMLTAALIITRGLKPAAGFSVTAGVLILFTIFTMPGALSNYAHQLPRLTTIMQDQSPYAWDRHVTLKAFWRLLLQGDVAGVTGWGTRVLWYGSVLGIAGLLFKTRGERLMPAALAAGPLMAPFCLDYDLLILAVPAVLIADEAIRARLDKKITGAWAVLYVTLHVSWLLARTLRVNLATIALAAVVLAISKRGAARSIPAARRYDPRLLKSAA